MLAHQHLPAKRFFNWNCGAGRTCRGAAPAALPGLHRLRTASQLQQPLAAALGSASAGLFTFLLARVRGRNVLAAVLVLLPPLIVGLSLRSTIAPTSKTPTILLKPD